VAEKPAFRGVVTEVIPMMWMSLAWLIDLVQRRFEKMVPCEARELLAAGRRKK